MNERIQRLIERSCSLQEVLCETIDLTNRPPRYIKRKALLDFQLENFVEAIVKECVLISRTSADGFSAGRRMEEHFGVE